MASDEGKAVGKAIDAARELGGFISRYVHGPLEQAMGIWEDKLKYLRWERQVRLMDQANQFLRERGIQGTTRAVSLQLAIPIMQGGSLEEDDALQDRWAMLLANAADANGPEVRRAYVAILEDLTSLDATILDKLFDADQIAPPEDNGLVVIWTDQLPRETVTGGTRKLDAPIKLRTEVEVSLVNLGRLGLISSAMAFGGMAALGCVHLTGLGREFVRACRRFSPEDAAQR